MEKKHSEPYLSTYLHARGRQLGLPISGTFELTARCNFSCPMCYVHLANARPEQELTASQWIQLARQARDAGMIFALITGGEPFLRKDFFEIYSAMKAMGLMVSINSNGSMLSGPVLEKLLADPPFRINISLYGGCRQTYRQMCGQDAFDQVLSAVRALHQAGVDVRLNLSITPYNRQDIRKILEISRQLGVHIKGTAYMYPPIRLDGCTSNRLTEDQAAQAAVEWDQLRFSGEEFALRAQAIHALQAVEPPECPVESDPGVACRAGSSSFWLTWDGRMTPCGMMPHPVTFPLEAGFQPAWQGILEATRAIRTPAQCAACPKKQICGVCAAVCLTETGSFDGVPEYMCRMTDGIVEKTWEAYSHAQQASPEPGEKGSSL